MNANQHKIIKLTISNNEIGFTMLFNDKNKLISLISSVIILFVPTLVVTNTNGIRSITETTIFFPWLIFIRLVPENPQFGTDMWNFVTPPISFIIFIPFLICLKYNLEILYRDLDYDEFSLKCTLLSIIQIFLLFILFQSQENRIDESVSYYYFPQILIIIINLKNSFKSYQNLSFNLF